MSCVVLVALASVPYGCFLFCFLLQHSEKGEGELYRNPKLSHSMGNIKVASPVQPLPRPLAPRPPPPPPASYVPLVPWQPALVWWQSSVSINTSSLCWNPCLLFQFVPGLLLLPLLFVVTRILLIFRVCPGPLMFIVLCCLPFHRFAVIFQRSNLYW